MLLNRAPTLHRLGIQAFEPQLIEGKAIQLHPLVCAAFNADFDGDQMAVHVPLSLEAQLEARVLMMSTNNILHPANGSPIIVPSQDIVLGLYYLSIMRDKEPGEGMAFGSVGEIRHALEAGAVTLHAKVKGRFRAIDADGNEVIELHDTTPGRMILGEVLPKQPGVKFALVNQLLTKKAISGMIDAVYRNCGQKETVIFCDRIMALGFHHAFKAGISFGKDDMVIPDTKTKIVDKTHEMVREFEQQYNDGLITQLEKYNKVVDAWSKCTDQIAKEMMERISADPEGQERPREADQLDLHDEPLGCARLAGADEAARGYARPHDQAVGRDHRDADHLELQGRPVGARVLQLDARRPQGPRRHRLEDRELGLPDAPSRRRGAGQHHLSRRTAEPTPASRCRRWSTPARSSSRSARACSAARRRRTSIEPGTKGKDGTSSSRPAS